jgi:3-oxoacyl-[acyl-carrier protein] reductase
MTVVISGGASGIGLATAKALAAKGQSVALLDLSPNLEDALKSLPGTGHSAHRVNVTDAAACQTAIDEIATASTIVGLVVSAGIVSEELLIDISPENFAKVMQINVFGVQNVIAPVARQMISTKTAGSIVVLASVAAFVGGGLMGRGAYATSKAALLGLVRSYARELAQYKIRTNTVSPGVTNTPMTASLSDDQRAKILAGTLTGTVMEPEELVKVIEFLLSDQSSAMSGQTLHANNGTFLG